MKEKKDSGSISPLKRDKPARLAWEVFGDQQNEPANGRLLKSIDTGVRV